MTDVTLIGDINIDAIMAIPTYPPPGGDAMAAQLTLRPGGSVLNTAIVLTRLGLQTKMIARVGCDPWAEMALEPLVKLGVDLSAIQRDTSVGTGLIFIPVTEDGERTMFSYRGANPLTSSESIDYTALGQPRHLHISSYNFLETSQREATEKAIELALQANTPISMDVGVEPARRVAPALLDLLPKLTVLVLSMEEAAALTGIDEPDEAAKVLLERGVKMVGLKLGRQGCQLATNSENIRLPGIKVITVDTTGAGDSFCAGLIFSRLAGLSLPAAGLLANTLGALATTVWGGGEELPGWETTATFLKTMDSKSYPGEFHNWRTEILDGFDTWAENK